jgi:hypothetical protein
LRTKGSTVPFFAAADFRGARFFFLALAFFGSGLAMGRGADNPKVTHGCCTGPAMFAVLILFASPLETDLSLGRRNRGDRVWDGALLPLVLRKLSQQLN